VLDRPLSVATRAARFALVMWLSLLGMSVRSHLQASALGMLTPPLTAGRENAAARRVRLLFRVRRLCPRVRIRCLRTTFATSLASSRSSPATWTSCGNDQPMS